MQANSTIMTLGEILVEIMATERGQSFLEPGPLIGPYASGAPAIFIDQVGRLGHPAGMIGCVGDDDFGRLNIERLRRDGCDTRAIRVLQQASTGSAFVTYRPDGERDFIFNISNSASAQLGPDDVSEALLRDCGHFHVMGSSLFAPSIVEAMKKAIAIVKRQGGTISFDPNVRKEILGHAGMREALRSILESTDIYLPSGSELQLLVDARDEAGAVAELLALGLREIVIKRGAAGSSFYSAAQQFDLPGFAVEEIDPTGAGDCFGATFVTCRMRGMTPEASLRHANAAGALAVGRRGPMEGTATLAGLQQFLAARRGSA